MPSLPPAIDLVVHRQGDGPPVVALHDMSQDGRRMLGALKALGTNYRLIAPDLRGHGGSPTPSGPWSIDDFASDVARLMAAEARGAVVVGVGLGAAAAIALTLGHPGLVGGLVLSGAGARSEDARGQDRWTRVARAIRERGGEHAEGVALATEALALRPDWRRALGQVDTPAIVVAGAADRAVPVERQRELAARMRNARFHVVPGAGHNIAGERPSELVKAVRELSAIPELIAA